MKQGKVYIVQRPAFYDKKRRGWVNKFDMSPAKKFGELEFLLRPGNIHKDKLEETVEYLKHMLYDFGSEDYILAVGDPVAIAITVMIASERTRGKVSLLKFDRRSGDYEAYELNLNL